ncbi:hypothetical protein ACNKHU_24825 [Shigella flexneri]
MPGFARSARTLKSGINTVILVLKLSPRRIVIPGCSC